MWLLFKSTKYNNQHKPLKNMAGVTGLEPATSAVTGQRSNQLSYTPFRGKLHMPLYGWYVNDYSRKTVKNIRYLQLLQNALHKSEMKLTAFTASALLTLSPSAGNSGVFNPQVFELNNGMRVALIENHRLPIITHMVWYKVGAMDEPASKSGLAHFLEHLMFKGTKKVAEGEFSKIIARKGGQDNAFTSWDYTAYYQQIPVKHLPLVMEMEADRMKGLKLSKTAFETEKKVILEERSSVVESNPVRLFGEQLHATLYMNHPYNTPVIGWRHEIENLSYNDVIDFYHTYYRPDNALLVVSGAVALPELKKLAEKTYGKIKPTKGDIERLDFTEPPHLAAREITMQREEVRLPIWQRQYIAPKYLIENEIDASQPAIALQVAAQILGGGETGRLYQRLVVEEKIASNASSWYDPSRRGAGMFGISVTARNDDAESLQKNLAEIDRLVDEEIDKLKQTPPSEEELKRAVTNLASAAVYARDGVMNPAMVVGQTLTIGLPIEYIENWPDYIKAVTAQNVADSLKELDSNAMVTGKLLP